MRVIGVVRGNALRRPQTVISALGPMGTPAANSGRAMWLNNGTHRGMRLDLIRTATRKPPLQYQYVFVSIMVW
jgi:hypothetical protein